VIEEGPGDKQLSSGHRPSVGAAERIYHGLNVCFHTVSSARFSEGRIEKPDLTFRGERSLRPLIPD